MKDKRSAFTLAHLLQDTVTDKIYCQDIAIPYYKDVEQTNVEEVQLYGHVVKGGVCKFSRTDKIASMKILEI